MKHDFTWPNAASQQHLRARYMDPGTGRFLSRDTWAGEYNMIMNPMVEKRIFMKRSRMFVYIFCLGIGLAVFGCSENSETPPFITPSQPANTVTAAPSRTPPPAITATPVITPTPIPVPTLPPDEAQALVLDLLYNPPCDLPCWWGIIPGETAWEEANRFLRKIGYVLFEGTFPEGNTFSEQIFFKVPNEVNEYRGSINATFGVERGIVKEIRIIPGKVPNHSLSEFLQKYGPPDEVWVYRYSEGPIETLDFSYFIFYQELGMLISMGVTNLIDSDGLIEGCINSDYITIEGPPIFLWAPDPQISFITVMSKGIIPRDPKIPPVDAFLLLKDIEINGMDEQGFYDIFVNPGTEHCINTPREKWPYIGVH